MCYIFSCRLWRSAVYHLNLKSKFKSNAVYHLVYVSLFDVISSCFRLRMLFGKVQPRWSCHQRLGNDLSTRSCKWQKMAGETRSHDNAWTCRHWYNIWNMNLTCMTKISDLALGVAKVTVCSLARLDMEKNPVNPLNQWLAVLQWAAHGTWLCVSWPRKALMSAKQAATLSIAHRALAWDERIQPSKIENEDAGR